MIISGLVKSSIIDYPNKIAAIVFTQGCNFSCGYCHNPELVTGKSKKKITQEEVLDYLKIRRNILDGLVVTGGEPLIYPDIEEFLQKVKLIGYQVKLDTNGQNPDLLEKLINNKLVDYVAMDIKSSLDKYREIVGNNFDEEKISKSIKLIMDKATDYEFRSTILPKHHDHETLMKMAILIKGSKRLFLQNFRNSITLDEVYKNEAAFSKKELEEIKGIFINFVQSCIIRDSI
jgi:pyruvate formate lyase activating enzyme